MQEQGLTCYLILFCGTECHVTTIKYLEKMKQIASDEKDIKVDIILFNTQVSDIFSCDKKPAEQAKETDVKAYIKKAMLLLYYFHS